MFPKSQGPYLYPNLDTMSVAPASPKKENKGRLTFSLDCCAVDGHVGVAGGMPWA